jgi:hypothetical protein
VHENNSFACVFRWIDLHEIILLQPPFLFELTKHLTRSVIETTVLTLIWYFKQESDKF